ncbi:MAG TPA: hypothetical protein DCM40_35880, partial [Maribacter sp.]|nr:hypothetical protein [Maribacter sp.]
MGNTVTNPSSNFSNQRGFAYVNSTGKVEIATTANDTVIDIGKNNANDGSLVVLRKQGTVVGSIASRSGAVTTMVFDPRTNGSGISGTTNGLIPTNQSGTPTNNHVDLGSSTNKFKDLHLSGAAKTDQINSDSFNLRNTSNGNMIKAVSGGAVTLYHNENAVVKTDGGGLVVESGMNFNMTGSMMIGATTAPTRRLDVSASGSTILANFKNTGGTTSFISLGNTTSTADQIRVGTDGTSLTLSTNYTPRLTINSSGNATFSGSVTVDGALGVIADRLYAGEGTSSGTRQQLTRSGTTNRLHSFTGSTSPTPYEIMMGATTSAFAIDTSANVNIPNGSFAIGMTSAATSLVDVRGSGNVDVMSKIINTGQTSNGRKTEFLFGKDNGANLSGTLRYVYDSTQANRKIELVHFGTSNGLSIADGGAATFSGSVSTDTIQNASGNLNILSTQNILLKFDSNNDQTNRELNIQSNSGDQLVQITETGATTFSGSVTANAGVQIDALNLDGRTIASTDPNGNINIHPNGSGTVNISTSLMVGATTAPAELLHVHESSTSASRIRLSNTDGYLEIGTNNQVSNLDSETHTFRNEAGSTEYMRIDSSGNLLVGQTAADSNSVGIGLLANGTAYAVRSGAQAFIAHRKSDDGTIIKLEKDNAQIGALGSNSSGGTPVFDISTHPTSGIMRMLTSGSERVRIDNSGRLLIGTTSTTPAFSTTNGHAFHVGDASHISRDQGVALVINRGTNDGGIVQFRKSGTYVGGIESRAGVVTTLLLNPASGNGAGISGGTKCIVPADESGIIDNDISLGISTHRFKDLHLSGNIRATSADIRNTSSGAETDVLILRNYAAGADTAAALKFFPTQSTTRFASIVAENVDGNNNIALSFLTAAGDTPSAALKLNQDRSALFSKNVIVSGNAVQVFPTSAGAASIQLQRQGITTSWSLAQGNSVTDMFEILRGTSSYLAVTSSGNVLVGKTADNDTSAGIRFQSNGSGSFVRDNNVALQVNRLTGDGNLMELRKDSSLIGAIGSTSGSMYIEGNPATGKSGLTFFGSYIEPRDNGSPADNAIDLGHSSNRFKDAHFSGAVNITNASGGSYFKAVQTSNNANAGYYMQVGSHNWFTLVDTAGRYQIYDGDAVATRVLVDTSGKLLIGGTTSSASGTTSFSASGAGQINLNASTTGGQCL